MDWSVLLHLLVGTTIIFHKANLSVVVPDQVLQREEAPAVRPHRDFTGQSQGFSWWLQQGHLVPVVTVKGEDSTECRALMKLITGRHWHPSLFGTIGGHKNARQCKKKLKLKVSRHAVFLVCETNVTKQKWMTSQMFFITKVYYKVVNEYRGLWIGL